VIYLSSASLILGCCCGESQILYLGGLCFVWVVVWLYQIRDSPQQHPRISEAELKYITRNIEYDTSKKVLPKTLQPNTTTLLEHFQNLLNKIVGTKQAQKS
jgi:hypothetical protein